MMRKLRKKRNLEKTSETEWVQVIDSDDADEEDQGTIVMNDTAISTTPPPKKLDTATFDRYFGNIWSSLSKKESASFAFIDSLWFSHYSEASQKRVISWIRPKHVFEKKYVLIPIVRWNHWNLLILCHFGDRSRPKNRTRCMLLLDSLHGANPKRIEPEIRKFVMDLHDSERRFEDKKVIPKIPLLVPKVPQQTDSDHCGYFVLYFMYLFIKKAPLNFSTKAGYPYFMKEDWFRDEDLDNFCSELRQEISGNSRTPLRKKTKLLCRGFNLANAAASPTS